MNIYKLLLIILFFIPLGLPLYGQENPVVLKRTPEQEAAKQTEKLQQELELNQTQANQVYEINLRYARGVRSLTKEVKHCNAPKTKMMRFAKCSALNKTNAWRTNATNAPILKRTR